MQFGTEFVVNIWFHFKLMFINFSGLIRSFSDRTYRVNDVASRFTWNQTITFDECTLDDARAVRDTMRVSVSRNFVLYDSNDRVVRFAMSNKVGLISGKKVVVLYQNLDYSSSDNSKAPLKLN